MNYSPRVSFSEDLFIYERPPKPFQGYYVTRRQTFFCCSSHLQTRQMIKTYPTIFSIFLAKTSFLKLDQLFKMLLF